MEHEGTNEELTVTSGEVVSEPEVSGEWLTPPVAAARLGVSERTLWRMVKKDRYQRRLVNTRAEILVPLPDTGATEKSQEIAEESRVNVSPVPVTRTDTLALAMIDEFRERRQQDAEAIERLTSRLTGLERENAVLTERLSRQAERRRTWWDKLLGR